MLELISFLCWHFLYVPWPNDMTRNILSTLHATSVVVAYLAGISIDYVYYISFGYYLADLRHEIRSIRHRPTSLQIGMIIHHILILLSVSHLFDPLAGDIYFDAFFIAEISNYPLYLYCHLRATGGSDGAMLVAVVLQTVFYFVFRLCGLAHAIYTAHIAGILHGIILIVAVLIYLMSVIWFVKMAKKLKYKAAQYYA